MTRGPRASRSDLDLARAHVVPGGRALVGHAEADRALVLVRLPLVDEAPGLLLAARHAVELEGDLAVPVEPEPAQRLLDLLGRLGDLAARVGVLDPQAELTAVMPREEPVEERRADATDVQQPGRARREADADGTSQLSSCSSAATFRAASRPRPNGRGSIGADALQLFVQSPRAWRFPDHDPAVLRVPRSARRRRGSASSRTRSTS